MIETLLLPACILGSDSQNVSQNLISKTTNKQSHRKNATDVDFSKTKSKKQKKSARLFFRNFII